jgi:Na+/proline symporter
MVQFFIKMSAVIAAAYFAVKLPEVGGMSGLVDKLSHLSGPNGLNYLSMLPDFTNNWDIALAVFVMPITLLWWSVWYPGAEPGGGSYIAQRMLASKSEKDALGGTLFFNVAHYVLRPWPWILVGLASLIVYPQLSDIQKAFPHLDPSLVGHDIAFPAMLRFLPAGWMGLMLGGLVAANSSTILTHLNWGASYLVHDFYRRFLNPGGSERHYVGAGRLATVLLFLLSSAMVFLLENAKDSFILLQQVGAGTGLLYLVRWFWWRVTAWCEIVAMISSFAISVTLFILKKNGMEIPTTQQFLLTIGLTTVCWLATAFLGPQTDKAALVAFYKKVHPAGPGWGPIRAVAGEMEGESDNMPMSLLGWVSGCIMIWSALFTVGNFLYGRMDYAAGLFVVFAITGLCVLQVVRKVWT